MKNASPFAGVEESTSMSTIRGRDANAARRMWIPLVQLDCELKQAAVDAGFFSHLPKTIKRFRIELRYTNTYRVVDESTGPREGYKNEYNICVEADGMGLGNGRTDTERYWPLKRICLEGFKRAAGLLEMPESVARTFDEQLAELPTSEELPPLPAFDESLVKHFGDPVDGGLPAKPRAPKKDKDGRIRQLKTLDADEGQVWVMLRIPTLFATDATDALFESLNQFIREQSLGEWDGESSGGHVADISFDTSNMRKAGKSIGEFLRERYPDVEFVISDDYETTFDEIAGAKS